MRDISDKPASEAKKVEDLFPFPRWIGYFPIALWPTDTEVRWLLGEKYTRKHTPASTLKNWLKAFCIWGAIAILCLCFYTSAKEGNRDGIYFWSLMQLTMWIWGFLLTIGWRFIFMWHYIRDYNEIAAMLKLGRTELPPIEESIAAIRKARAAKAPGRVKAVRKIALPTAPRDLSKN